MTHLQDRRSGYRLVETRLQEKLPDGRTRCLLCPWRCRLHHGQRGFCQAHINRHGTLYNISYGIISALDVSAIEDKPVRHYRPGTRVLNVGSYGCSFRCGGCHNLDISWGVTALEQLARGESSAAYVMPQQLIELALEQNVQGIAFTYSEPVVWLEYVLAVAELARQAGLYTVYVSNSFVTDESLELIAPFIDVLCSDIKSMSDSFYQGVCRSARVSQILQGIEKAQRLGLHVETRTNIIPGKNDSDEEFRHIAQWIREHLGDDSPWHITRFFPAFKLADVPATPVESLRRAQAVAHDCGLQHVYVYADRGCDCAEENAPVSAYLEGGIPTVNKCSASCCGDEGVLLKKYEREAGLLSDE